MAKAAKTEARRSGRPSKDQARDSRTLILEAALDLFSTVGYEASTMKLIGERVGVRDSAIYAHFEGKAGIRDELIQTYGPQSVRRDWQKIEWRLLLDDPEQGLKTILSDLAKRWLSPDESKFFRFMMMENLRRETESSLQIPHITARLRGRLKKVMLVMLATGKLRKADPDWLVGQFLAPIYAIRIDIAFRREEKDEKEIVERLHRHVEEFFRVFVIS